MPDLVPGNKLSTSTILVGSTISSAIDSIGDTDWWRVLFSTGFSYQIWLFGSTNGLGTLFDPYLGIYNIDGTFLSGNNDIVTANERDSYILWTLS